MPTPAPPRTWPSRVVLVGFVVSWVARIVALLIGVDGAWANVITLTNLVLTGGFLVLVTRARGEGVR